MEFLGVTKAKTKVKVSALMSIVNIVLTANSKMQSILCYGISSLNFPTNDLGEHLKNFSKNRMRPVEYFYHIHSIESPVCYLVSLLCSTKTFPKTSLISFRDFRAIFVSRFFFFSMHMKFNFEPKSVRKIVWPTTTTTTATDCSDKIKMDAINLCLYGIVSNELLKSC